MKGFLKSDGIRIGFASAFAWLISIMVGCSPLRYRPVPNDVVDIFSEIVRDFVHSKGRMPVDYSEIRKDSELSPKDWQPLSGTVIKVSVLTVPENALGPNHGQQKVSVVYKYAEQVFRSDESWDLSIQCIPWKEVPDESNKDVTDYFASRLFFDSRMKHDAETIKRKLIRMLPRRTDFITTLSCKWVKNKIVIENKTGAETSSYDMTNFLKFHRNTAYPIKKGTSYQYIVK